MKTKKNTKQINTKNEELNILENVQFDIYLSYLEQGISNDNCVEEKVV